MTGMDKGQHCKENKRRRLAKQSSQDSTNYWSTHRGVFAIPCPKLGPAKHTGSMCPAGLALHHPAAGKLLEFATQGCPTLTGKPWTVSQIEEVIHQGPHVLVLQTEAMQILAEEVEAKGKRGNARWWCGMI